jgi:hypothetical protein
MLHDITTSHVQLELFLDDGTCSCWSALTTPVAASTPARACQLPYSVFLKCASLLTCCANEHNVLCHMVWAGTIQ